jgi:hypothetical protein
MEGGSVADISNVFAASIIREMGQQLLSEGRKTAPFHRVQIPKNRFNINDDFVSTNKSSSIQIF